MSPRPPSKNGASGWYLLVSMVLAAKSSEKTTVEIWAEARGRQTHRPRIAAATSKFRHPMRERKYRVGDGGSLRTVGPIVVRAGGELFFLISSHVWVSAPPHP